MNKLFLVKNLEELSLVTRAVISLVDAYDIVSSKINNPYVLEEYLMRHIFPLTMIRVNWLSSDTQKSGKYFSGLMFYHGNVYVSFKVPYMVALYISKILNTPIKYPHELKSSVSQKVKGKIASVREVTFSNIKK